LNSIKKMGKSDKLRKNLENKLQKQKEEMEKVLNSVEETKQQLNNEKKELEKKLKEEKEKNEEKEKLSKEMEENKKKQIVIQYVHIFEIKNENENNEIIKSKKTESIKEDEDEQKKLLSNNNNSQNKKLEINNDIENNKSGDDIKEDLDNKSEYKNYENNENVDYIITNSEKGNNINDNINSHYNNDIDNNNISNKNDGVNNNELQSVKNDEKNDINNKNDIDIDKNDEKNNINKDPNNDEIKSDDNIQINNEINNDEKNNKEEKKNDVNDMKKDTKNNDNNNDIKDEIKEDKPENNEEINENIKKNKNVNDGKLKKEINKILQKEEQILYAKQLSEKIVEEIIKMKECEISPNNKYKAEYYNGSIISLINKIESSLPIDKIDEEIKIAFDLENNIYNEESYLKGQYPQVIICKSYENEEEISGICSFHQQNSTKEEKKVNINFICAIKYDDDNDLFEQFITMINFIKNYVIFDELYVTLNYNKIILEEGKEKYILNEKILKFFKKEMNFAWVCVENIIGKSRKQKLSYKNEKKNENENEEDININNNDTGFLSSETISLLSFIKKDNNNNDKKNNYNFNNYKYMNNLPIYAIISGQNELLLVDFKDNKYRFDYSKLFSKENPIITIFSPENRTLEDLKLNLNENYDNIFDIIEDSLFFENYNKFKENQIISYFGLFKMNLNIFFQNILNTKINNYYYNRISSNEIQVIKDNQYNCTFYILPCLNNINSILLFEINDKLKNILIDNNLNIYTSFIKYFNKIIERNNNIEKKENNLINLYIPSFCIETHLLTEKTSKEITNIDIFENKENNDNNDNNDASMKISSVDEFLKINFNKIKPIERQINFEINDEENTNNIIIKNDFILGIMNNFTKINFPLFQLIYVQKEFWIKYKKESE